MNISVATNVPVQFLGEEKGLELISKVGFDTVDYSLYIPGDFERLLSDDYLLQAQRTKQLLKKYGLKCSQAHAGFKFEYGMEMDVGCPEFLYACRCIEYAAVLGARDIVVHTVWVTDKSVDAVDYNIGFYKSLEPFAKKFGIRIAVENAAGTKSVEQVNCFCAVLPAEHFVVCMDIGHVKKDGFEPSEFARGIAPGRLQSLHVHDNHGAIDEHALPFLGAIDWEETLRALVEVGYDGDFTMEAGKFLKAFPKELLPDALKFYYSVTKHLGDKLELMKKESASNG